MPPEDGGSGSHQTVLCSRLFGGPKDHVASGWTRVDEPGTPTEDDYAAPESGSSVILASFGNRHAAEHGLASLRRGFRKEARKGRAKALVISGNKDGSLKVTPSRVLSASDAGYTLTRISLSVTIGFTGILSSLKGAKGAVHEVRERKSGVGADETAAHALLAQVGPNAALVLITCDDQKMRQTVATEFADRASKSWDGSRAQFLADLDPGSQHDWVRATLDA
jgi:hypothetical protein